MPLVPHISYPVAILLGLLQGLTEFLPVSSTAHMEVIPQLFRQPDPGAAFSAVAQLGPIIAIIVYFWTDIVRYIQGIIRTKSPAAVPADDIDARLGWFTLLGTLPILVFGALFQAKVETVFRDLRVTAASFILLGLFLWLAEATGRRKTALERISLKESQVIGWAQVLALIPGTSRSGVTITAGLFQGLKREAAARFSFLLSIPAITAAGLWELHKVLKHYHYGPEAGAYLLSAVVAGLFAYVVIKWFLGYVKEHNTAVFIIYRILLGIAILVLLHMGYLKTPKLDPVNSRVTTTAQAGENLVPTGDGHFVPADTDH